MLCPLTIYPLVSILSELKHLSSFAGPITRCPNSQTLRSVFERQHALNANNIDQAPDENMFLRY